MNLRKVTAAILSTVVAASVVAGCSGVTPKSDPKTAAAAPAGQKVDLEFWGWWSSATRMPTINKLIDQWNQNNPDVHVKYTFVPYDQIMTKYLASVAAGNPPAVVASPELFTVSRRAQKKQAMDLSTLGADSLKDQYYPQLWNAAQFNGKPYALPWVGETKYLYYNKEQFKERPCELGRSAEVRRQAGQEGRQQVHANRVPPAAGQLQLQRLGVERRR
jgi:ABC-type glycerol-3-phosphate transport system substrate-binding protein